MLLLVDYSTNLKATRYLRLIYLFSLKSVVQSLLVLISNTKSATGFYYKQFNSVLNHFNAELCSFLHKRHYRPTYVHIESDNSVFIKINVFQGLLRTGRPSRPRAWSDALHHLSDRTQPLYPRTLPHHHILCFLQVNKYMHMNITMILHMVMIILIYTEI